MYRRFITSHWAACRSAVAAVGTLLWIASWCAAANWQYRVPFEREPDRNGKARDPGDALLWLPPACETLRGLLITGQLGIEGELNIDPVVRQACRDHDIGIVYFAPHLSGVFHYWEAGNNDGQRLLRALDDLAQRSGHAELRRVPWITAGHSTAGIFCRNVAYWKPERVAGVIHIKSGNFHQREHLPPSGSLAGVPLVAINGQFETYGPAGGIRPELGRETQWTFVLKDIQQFRTADPRHLMSVLVHPGADHFHGAPELAQYAALLIRKTAQYRLPPELPAGSAPVECLPLKPEDGWLTDPDLYAPQHPPAAYADFAGGKKQGLWHYDQEMAEATTKFHENLGHHQVLTNPVCTWLDQGDGWTFRARAEFLDVMPEKYGGRAGGQRVGHSGQPFVYRCKINEPVEQLGPDTFRLLRPARRVNVAAFHPGDDRYRSTIRWGSIEMPRLNGARPQTIDFAPLPDLKASSRPVKLKAKASSGLQVVYEVEYGPVVIDGDTLEISEVPHAARYPLECRITAYQIGRRSEPAVSAAEPVSVTFKIVGG